MNSTKVENEYENQHGGENDAPEEEDYLYNKAFKVNTKTDAGSTRPKGRIPIWKLKLENETEIPPMPSEIFEKPNDKHYEKELAQIEQEIKHHQKSIEETKEKIKQEKYGNSPEIKKLNEEKGPLKEKKKELDDSIKELESKVEGPKRDLEDFRAQKDALAKELEVLKLDSLNAEIKSIQHKLGFSSLSVSEEKKLIERKSRLEAQKPKVERYAQVSAKIRELNEANKEIFEKLRVLYAQRKPLNENLRKNKERLDLLYKNVKENDPNIKNLELIKTNIFEQIKKCQQRKKDINKEWNDKWYHYEDQQKLINYIKEATETINKLKKKEEKDRKRREKAAKKESEETEETVVTQAADVKLFEYEIATCKWLVGYFKNLAGIKDTTQLTTQSNTTQPKGVSSKLDEDIKKGLIKEIKKENDEDVFGISSVTTQSKKKSKGPKISKREQKLENSNNISLDLEVIRKIKDVGLTPPALKSQLPTFISSLEKTQEDFVKKSDPNKVESAPLEEAEIAICKIYGDGPKAETHTETHVEETVVHNEQENLTTITVTKTIITTTEAKDAEEEGEVEEVVEETTEIVEESV